MYLIYVLFLCVCIARCVRADEEPSPPVTVTPSGTIRGSWMTSRKGRQIEAYRNIPFAQPPIGNLRFQEAIPINKYSQEVDASEEGPMCPQPVIPESPGYMDEDCLKMNVYTTSKNSTTLRPVVVFLNYGGFYVLSGRSDVVGPRYLLDQDLVLVTFNFRLGSLDVDDAMFCFKGFFSTGDKLAPGNNGFKDQVVVLRWIQKNIAAFGGDPSNVTLLGCGSGSYSATLHMISPMSRGLFHRVLSISSSPFSQVRIGPDQFDLAVKQARLVGCPYYSSKVMINCLRSKPWKEIAESVNGFIEFEPDRVIYWTVVVEGDFGQERFMPYDPLDAVRSGQLYSVPYIISQTRNEYSWLANVVLNNPTLTRMLNREYTKYAPIAFLLPKSSELQALKLREKYLGRKQLQRDSESAENLGKLFGDALIGFSAHRLANLMCRNSKASVYYYLFDYIGNNSFYRDDTPDRKKGVAHHDDLIYLFSMPGLFPDIGLNSSDANVVDKMTAIIYAFARFGYMDPKIFCMDHGLGLDCSGGETVDRDPNIHDSVPELLQLSWPRMTAANRSYLRISTNFSINQNLYEDRFSLWDNLFPIIYTPKVISVMPINSIIGNVLGLISNVITGILG